MLKNEMINSLAREGTIYEINILLRFLNKYI